MIGKAMQDALNEQIKHEMGSMYLYLSMSAYFNAEGMDGMAHWMRMQAMEEEIHAMKFFDHIKDRDGRVILQALEQPKSEWASPLDAFKAAYEHEQFITGKINDLVKLSREENDNAAFSMLQWFVEEQVEEEASVSKVIQMLKLAGDNGYALLMIDKELSMRQPPVATQQPAEGGE